MKIRTKLYLIVAALALLMAVSGVVGFMSISVMTKTSDRMFKIQDNMNSLQEVRVVCQRLLRPVHDYLLHGNKEEIKNFDVLLGTTNEKLDELSRRMKVRKYYIEHPEEMKDQLDKIREDLLKIEGLSRKILNIPNPMGSIEAALWMKEMDSYADKLTDNLDLLVEWNRRRTEQRMATVYKTQTTATITFIVTILLFVGSGIGGGILIIRSITIPISRLVEGTERIAEGDLSHRIAIGAKDEISHLASSFNKMTEDLQATTVSRQFHEGITEGISDELMVIDPQNYKIISANKAFLERYGPRDEVIGKTCYQVTHGFSEPCKPPEHICPTEEALRTGMHSVAEHVHMDKEHKRRYQEISVSPLKDKTGTVYQVIHIEKDITERKRLEKDVRDWVQALEAKTKELEDFIFIVSHDLKEPLRGFASFSQFLLEDYADKLDEKGRGYLLSMMRNTEWMKRLINDLLSVSKTTLIEVPFQITPASEVIKEAVESLKVLIDKKGIELVIAKASPKIYCDKPRIIQVFQNLLGNSIKFMDKENPRIEIGYQDKIDYDQFYVKDNGIGIEKDYCEKVFGMFERLHRREDYDGTGAGLYICKKIIEGHHGKIWIESKKGVGSIFYFTLPKKKEEKWQ